MSIVSPIDSGKSRSDATLKYPWVEDAYKSNETALKWFQDSFSILVEHYKFPIQRMYENTLWYLGIYDQLSQYQVQDADGTIKKIPQQVIPFVISHLSRLTNKRVADLSALKSTFDVFPNDAKEKSRIKSRLMKPILRDIKRRNNADMIFDDAELWNSINGSVFIGVEWNKEGGDKRAPTKEEQKKEPKLEYVREGCVAIRVIDPTHVLPWPVRQWNQVKCVVVLDEILSVDEARRKFENNDIEPDGLTDIYDFDAGYRDELRSDEVTIWKVYYKPDKYLPNGFIGTFTKKQCLAREFEAWPYSHEDFPFERYTSIDTPRSLVARSFYEYIKPIQHHFNLLHGLIKRNIYHGAHPKWMMVKGAANIRSLGNAFTVVQHRLNQKPELVSYPTTNPEVFKYAGDLKSEMESLANQQTISTGNLPPNTRSGIMISRLMEIEKQTRGPQLDKRNDFMRRVLLKAAAIASDYLPKTSKDNLARIVGDANVEDIMQLAGEKISAEYRLEIINAAGFSETLVGRIEEVGYLMEKVPGAVTREEALDIIAFRAPEKYYDIGTASLKAAQQENEMLDDGQDIAPPMAHEDHFVHWRTHFIDMQSLSFKRLPKKIQESKIEHISMHEMFMAQDSAKNPAFTQQLAQIPFFPVYFKPLAVTPPTQGLPPPADMNGAPPQAPEQTSLQGKQAPVPLEEQQQMEGMQ